MILSVGESSGPLAVLHVKEHADACRDELLQRVGGLDRLASEPRFLGHDEHLERWPWFGAFISRRNPSRFTNSAPLIPSST
jgi:hypothetical protein